MGFLKKSKRAGRNVQAAVASLLGTTDMMVAKGFMDSCAMDRITKMDAVLNMEREKQDKDMHAFYEGEMERIRGKMNQQLDATIDQVRKEAYDHYNKEALAYEDKARREYDEKMAQPKAHLKREVMGDVLTMAMWVLQNKLNFDREQMHTFLHQFFQLEADMQEPRLGPITINDLARQMNEEGYNLQEDIELIDELVEAECERYDDLYGKPYAPRGSIKDKWRPKEEARMKRLLLKGVNYLTIGVILGRSEGACKARARKIFGTTDPAQIKEDAA